MDMRYRDHCGVWGRDLGQRLSHFSVVEPHRTLMSVILSSLVFSVWHIPRGVFTEAYFHMGPRVWLDVYEDTWALSTRARACNQQYDRISAGIKVVENR